MASRAQLIEESLERLAERAGDPTPAVYARLFAAYPETEPLFVRDVDGAVRGEMLTKVIELAQDLAGPRVYAANFIRSELINHEGVGVSRAVFPRFFAIAVAAFRELAGDAWSEPMAQAWSDFLAEVEEITSSV
jgi:hemoglobin-like flavoprotein